MRSRSNRCRLYYYCPLTASDPIPANLEFKFACSAERIQGRVVWPIFEELTARPSVKRIFRIPYTTLRQNDRVRVECSLIHRMGNVGPDQLLFVAYNAIRI